MYAFCFHQSDNITFVKNLKNSWKLNEGYSRIVLWRTEKNCFPLEWKTLIDYVALETGNHDGIRFYSLHQKILQVFRRDLYEVLFCLKNGRF